MNQATIQAVARIQTINGALLIGEVAESATAFKQMDEPLRSARILSGKAAQKWADFGQQQLNEIDWYQVLEAGQLYRSQFNK